jgi:expansin (peptidoglycan-binding protein)
MAVLTHYYRVRKKEWERDGSFVSNSQLRKTFSENIGKKRHFKTNNAVIRLTDKRGSDHIDSILLDITPKQL